MPNIPGLPFDPADFSGQVRLFPLPDMVMFPHALQLLHVFEPRYREMVREALAGDQLIAMVLLQPGWEKDYEGRPPVHPVGCLGRIATCKELPDGRYNLLLHGLARVELLGELPPERPFRVARARLRPDRYPVAGDSGRAALRDRLLDGFRAAMPDVPKLREQLDLLLEQDVPLGVLSDIVAYTLEIELAAKQQLLEESDVDERCRRLVAAMQVAAAVRAARRRQPFPPDFSNN